MSTHADVLIVGGGVIGLTTAYFLAEAGVKVTVMDQGDLGQQASWAGAGIISPGNPERASSPGDLLRAHSAALYPDLSRRLLEETGIDNGYRICGGVELDIDEGLMEHWRGEGITFHELRGAELRRHEPGLAAEWDHGCYLPHMAQVRNPRHVKALVAACTRRGVALEPGCAVRGFVQGKGRITAVDSERGRLSAGRYLVCSGAWTDLLLQQVGQPTGIHPVRGQIALLNTAREGTRPIVLVGKRYLVPREDGRVLVGATEEDAGFQAQPTAGGIGGLLAFAAQLLPELAGVTLERCWAGLRPGSPDGLPFLGPVPGWDNLFVAAGHFRAGIQRSPATGLLLRQLLLGQPTTMPLEPFRIGRPAAATVQTAFRS